MAHKHPYDVGEDRRDPAEEISAPGSKRIYPSETINDTILPLLEGAKEGQEIRFDGILHITGSREPHDFDTIQKGSYVSFEIRKIGIPGSFEEKGEPSHKESQT